MTLEYSFYKKSSKSKKNKSSSIKQIEITIKKNGVIRIELIPYQFNNNAS
jgi:hypothetical protein